jgi:hypothetical protein
MVRVQGGPEDEPVDVATSAEEALVWGGWRGYGVQCSDEKGPATGTTGAAASDRCEGGDGRRQGKSHVEFYGVTSLVVAQKVLLFKIFAINCNWFHIHWNEVHSISRFYSP